MGLALTLQEFLENNGIEYDIVPHSYSHSSLEAAESARIPGDKLAKCVVLGDGDGYVMAVLPSTHRVDLNIIERYLGRHVELASERDLNELFFDCEVGAVPPVGGAYGFETIVDHSLLSCDDIYFEAGDHEDLVHLSGPAFCRLMEDAEPVPISRQG
ncbi:MAG: YbaK/EbsC family protein [Gammaproteobacteria bacterium]|nr:YbaK/EbsC family protein [Gammaproteobacteria bacterium]